MALPPGPRTHRRIRGFLPEFRKDPLDLLTRVAREYGEIVRLQLGPWHFILLSSPDLIEQVLVTQSRQMMKGRGIHSPLLGNGLLTAEGDHWRRQRRLVQPAFHRERIATYGDAMVGITLRHIAPWQDGTPLDISQEMMALTLAIATHTLFAAKVTEDAQGVSRAIDTALHHFQSRVRSILAVPYSWPTPANIRARKAVGQLNDVIYRIIDERRAGGGQESGDLLAMLLQAVDEDGAPMTREQLRDEVMTLFLAGHETTANALSWTWHLLAQHPEAEARLHAEIDAVLQNRPPAPADLPRLPYVDAVINESMRICPPAWIMSRKATAPVTIGGYAFAPGTEFLVSQWVTHRSERWFDDPLAFRPERWLDGLAKRLPTFAYFPFGGGPRMCVGKGFALMEAQLLLAAIAQRFRFALQPGRSVTFDPSITLRPAAGIHVTAHARRQP